ncbi:MAG TPA: C40 family peptidase [Vicinamibacterales bacterium]
MSCLRHYAIVIPIAVLSGACASSGATPRPFPTPGGTTAGVRAPAPAPAAAASPLPARGSAYEITGTALSLRGTPYRDGGTDPSGFDCSGFVQYVFAQHGVKVPRNVREQFRAGEEVGRGELQPGDLVFFTTVTPGASHVGIALGGDEFVHAPSSTGEVRVERLNGTYWAPRYVGARRVI